MVPLASAILVSPVHRNARPIGHQSEGLQDGAAILLSAADIVDGGCSGGGDESGDELGDILRMDVVPDLLPLVANDGVLPLLHVALHELTEKPVQVDARVRGPGRAAATEAARRHTEVAAILLHHHISRHLRRPEERVLATVDPKCLRDAVRERRIGVVPTGFLLDERNLVRCVSVDLVGRHMNEGRILRMTPSGFEQIERADGIGVEIIEGNRSRPVV